MSDWRRLSRISLLGPSGSKAAQPSEKAGRENGSCEAPRRAGPEDWPGPVLFVEAQGFRREPISGSASFLKPLLAFEKIRKDTGRCWGSVIHALGV
jgi:hypothetical protein